MKFPKLHSPAILSPMAGVTDVAFRTLCKRYGAGLTCTEFLSSAAIVRNNKRTMGMLATDPSEKPVAIQLFGNSADEIVKAAKFAAAAGALACSKFGAMESLPKKMEIIELLQTLP